MLAEAAARFEDIEDWTAAAEQRHLAAAAADAAGRTQRRDAEAAAWLRLRRQVEGSPEAAAPQTVVL